MLASPGPFFLPLSSSKPLFAVRSRLHQRQLPLPSAELRVAPDPVPLLGPGLEAAATVSQPRRGQTRESYRPPCCHRASAETRVRTQSPEVRGHRPWTHCCCSHTQVSSVLKAGPKDRIPQVAPVGHPTECGAKPSPSPRGSSLAVPGTSTGLPASLPGLAPRASPTLSESPKSGPPPLLWLGQFPTLPHGAPPRLAATTSRLGCWSRQTKKATSMTA